MTRLMPSLPLSAALASRSGLVKRAGPHTVIADEDGVSAGQLGAGDGSQTGRVGRPVRYSRSRPPASVPAPRQWSA